MTAKEREYNMTEKRNKDASSPISVRTECPQGEPLMSVTMWCAKKYDLGDGRCCLKCAYSGARLADDF